MVFQGPQDYVTPSWYATKRETGKVVPTWNYVTVHAWGAPRVMDDPVWLRRQIGALTDKMERPTRCPLVGRRMHRRSSSTTQIRAIVGIEIPIGRIEGKWKLEPEPDRRRPAWGGGRVPR